MDKEKYKYKIDTHVHSKSSDGDLDIFELLDLAEKRGMCALVLTDHFRIDTPSYFHNKGVLYHFRNKLKNRINIFVGAEIDSPFYHLNIFGDRAIVQYYKNINKLNYFHKKQMINEWIDLFIKTVKREEKSNAKIESVVIVNHPDAYYFEKYNKKVYRRFLSIIKHVEFSYDFNAINSEFHYFDGKKIISTSDAHYNEVGKRHILLEQKPKTIEELMHLLKGNKFYNPFI